jgi:probable rRNA maturation factor
MPARAETSPPARRNPVVLVSRDAGLGRDTSRYERAVKAEAGGILSLIRSSSVMPALSIYLCSDRSIARLNRRWLGKTGATNVISFQSPDLRARTAVRGPVPLRRGSLRGFAGSRSGELFLGDLAISLERARKEALRAGLDPVDWTAALAHHGLMHILGYSHRSMPPRRRRP